MKMHLATGFLSCALPLLIGCAVAQGSVDSERVWLQRLSEVERQRMHELMGPAIPQDGCPSGQLSINAEDERELDDLMRQWRLDGEDDLNPKNQALHAKLSETEIDEFALHGSWDIGLERLRRQSGVPVIISPDARERIESLGSTLEIDLRGTQPMETVLDCLCAGEDGIYWIAFDGVISIEFSEDRHQQ